MITVSICQILGQRVGLSDVVDTSVGRIGDIFPVKRGEKVTSDPFICKMVESSLDRTAKERRCSKEREEGPHPRCGGRFQEYGSVRRSPDARPHL